MGREVKRVPMDFNHPLREVWGGYINPYLDKMDDCPACEGKGGSYLYLALQALWYGYGKEYALSIAMKYQNEKSRDEAVEFISNMPDKWILNLEQVDVQCLWDNGRLWGFGRKDIGDLCPNAEDVNKWAMGHIMAHDGLNSFIAISNRCDILGYEKFCEQCDGDGSIFFDPKDKIAYENWEPIEPPYGDGYQLWETVSEGSPVSPVFESSRDLSFWMMESGYEEWQYMDVRNGKMYLPSGFFTLKNVTET